MERLHFMNFIWSDCILVESEGKFALVDTGEVEHMHIIIPYLEKLGIKEFEFVYVSHFHYDHFGGAETILKNYKVKNYYTQEYSGCDGDDGSGHKMDDVNDEYHTSTRNHYEKLLSIANLKCEHTEVISDETKEIVCGKFRFKPFRTKNYVKMAFNDSNQYCYQKCILSENGNSSPLFACVNGKNVFLGSDIGDYPHQVPYLSYVNTSIAKELNCQMDIYKVPHHGTSGCNTKEALDIYKPKHAIITNSYWYLERWNTLKEIMAANPNCKILTTEKKYLVYTIPEDGDITYELISQKELFN